MQAILTAVTARLNAEGVFPKPDWLAQCLDSLAESEQGLLTMSTEEQLQRCFGQFLLSDMNISANGAMPAGVQQMHKQQLTGRFILQVDEVADMGSPAKERYAERGAAGAGRCLKLSLTDGSQRVSAVEYRRIDAIAPHMPAGIKVMVTNAPVRRGLLLLSRENVDVLGGRVEALEQARLRAVKRWSQPPRGRRGGPADRGNAPSLAAEATAAAWPAATREAQEGASLPRATENAPGGTGGQGGDPGHAPRPARPPGTQQQPPGVGQGYGQQQRQAEEHIFSGNGATQGLRTGMGSALPEAPEVRQRAAQGPQPGSGGGSTVRPGGQPSVEARAGEPSLQEVQEAREALGRVRKRQSSACFPTPRDDPPLERFSQQHPAAQPAWSAREPAMGTAPADDKGAGAGHQIPLQRETQPRPGRLQGNGRAGMPPNRHADPEDEDEPEVEIVDVRPSASYENGHSPDGQSPQHGEPFSYLATLLPPSSSEGGDWGSSRPGFAGRHRIKCLVVSVREFKAAGFRLVVVLDDGTRMWGARVDRRLLEARLGITCEEAMAALEASDRKEGERVREVLKGMEGFLSSFEGVVEVEWDAAEGLLRVVAMAAGAASIDPYALLRQVKGDN